MVSWPEEGMGALLFHSLPSSLEMGSLTEPGARLGTRKSQ